MKYSGYLPIGFTVHKYDQHLDNEHIATGYAVDLAMVHVADSHDSMRVVFHNLEPDFDGDGFFPDFLRRFKDLMSYEESVDFGIFVPVDFHLAYNWYCLRFDFAPFESVSVLDYPSFISVYSDLWNVWGWFYDVYGQKPDA